jgi:hypothetical protein
MVESRLQVSRRLWDRLLLNDDICIGKDVYVLCAPSYLLPDDDARIKQRRKIYHVLEDSIGIDVVVSSPVSISAIISPRSSSPSLLSLSVGFFGSSLCIATYIAEPRINEDPMIDKAPGVVPHTNLSKVSANNICM